jgi:hypothetical protein
MKPITPNEALSQYPDNSIVPDEMIRVINDLLRNKFDGKSVEITHEDIRTEWAKHEDFPKLSDYHWADFKPLFIKSGWDVTWIKESNYAESGYDRWEFKPKK